ncbi:hypothetical protein [Saccharopolyspora pogona]|uniref:hypothetical protein n=1 Tax=Saccharopolyspora pogona TaxID=333966 RepID=UPI001688F2CC|nr:hypothetical protein [Saccharopolyspora pogona]
MSDDQSVEDVPTGYWAAFGYHNHVLPTDMPPRKDGKHTTVCGALTPPAEVSERDDRPVCSWCSEQVRTGRIQIVPRPDTA